MSENPQDRRKFERVTIPASARLYVTDTGGRKLGVVRMIGRGGFLLESKNEFRPGDRHHMLLVDEREGVRRHVHAVVRYSSAEGIGFEFERLEPDAAVDVGIIIGRYYHAPARR
jgi:hypothetical protein